MTDWESMYVCLVCSIWQFWGWMAMGRALRIVPSDEFTDGIGVGETPSIIGAMR